MKLPYRVGDSFALPIGDGTTVDARIVARNHHTVDIEVADLTLRVRDSALVLHRWKCGVIPSVVGERSAFTQRSRGVLSNDGWGTSPAYAERIVAMHRGIANLALAPLDVHNQWKPEFAPGYVRIAKRGITLDPRTLPQDLEVLDLSGVALTSLAFPPAVRALRLAWISTPIDLRELAKLPLHTLHLEELRELRGVEMLAAMTSLRQLQMLGFWQLGLDDVTPLLGLSRLVRAEIDIGGRRKSIELYKRATWAYPWPFELAVNG